MVSSDHRVLVYSNYDLTLDSTSHVIARDNFMRSRSLVMDYFIDIIIADITAGQRNLSMLLRNWTLQTKPTVRYCNSFVVGKFQK